MHNTLQLTPKFPALIHCIVYLLFAGPQQLFGQPGYSRGSFFHQPGPRTQDLGSIKTMTYSEGWENDNYLRNGLLTTKPFPIAESNLKTTPAACKCDRQCYSGQPESAIFLKIIFQRVRVKILLFKLENKPCKFWI